MTTDKELQELFRSANIQFDDNDEFLELLDTRLEKVEYVRKIQDSRNKRYKLSIYCALLIGIAVEALSMTYFYHLPQLRFDVFPALPFHIVWMNSTVVFSTVFALILGLGAYWLIRNLQEIRQMLATQKGR